MLVDGLPYELEIQGRTVPIDTDFRTGIRFEKVMMDERMSSRDKLLYALDLYFPDVRFSASELEAAVEAILWFYRRGREYDPNDDESDGRNSEEESFSYEHDAGYVFAAFMQAYNIDLTTAHIHWWQFRALFESLPEDVMIVKIIGYRTAEIPQKASTETRQRIEKMKRLYALPVSADRKKLTTDLEAILMAGGNPYDLLNGGGDSYGIRRNTEI